MKRANVLKEALCALCRLLSASGSHWDPETFRKSKFNRPEAASEFWNLLYSLLRQIFPGEQDSSPSAHEKINLADRVTYVKSVLLIQGYGRLKFYLLPGDGEEGSREILLAFSWLLHRVKILEILLQKKRVQVGDHITICLIHSYTQGCHIDKNTGHLSVMETELVRQPKSCAKLLQVMESEISYLEAYLEWKHVESVYWQWMDTVLESACEDEHGFSSQNMSKVVFTSTSQPQYKPTDMKVLSKCLRDTQDRLHKLAALGTSLSQEQIKEIEIELGKKELKKIKQEVRKLMGHCKVQVVEAKDIHGSYRLLLKEPKLHKSVNKDCSTNEVHVTQVTKHLQTVICTMEAESYQLQEQCRKRLDDITQELEGILCIPPAKG
ncbi:tubulin epsilon and delta complex protein 1 isoform X4 [Hyla sarda]|uniref:tubulin epsilon and delta complex protein 1 isoform X4 n=1 Tax=Hyla sarda TaxID=327740 RepID=UPI0024C3C0CD|nr:tubulin epsilon and delta complex protein 1 isoform X4 [Hyla sarda]